MVHADVDDVVSDDHGRQAPPWVHGVQPVRQDTPVSGGQAHPDQSPRRVLKVPCGKGKATLVDPVLKKVDVSAFVNRRFDVGRVLVVAVHFRRQELERVVLDAHFEQPVASVGASGAAL